VEQKFYAPNYHRIRGNEYQKYIPDLNLMILFKANNDFHKSKSMGLVFHLFLSIFISSISSSFLLFLVGKNLLLEPHIDLAKNKQLLLEKTEELQKSNEELDSFAHTVSHDLKEPIRGMSFYASAVLKAEKNKLSDDSTEMMEDIIKLGAKAATMLSSILNYSKLGRVDLAYQATDIQKAVDDVVFSLEVFMKEHNAQVLIPESLPSVQCDSVRVGEVFRNLITNGIKYNNKTEKFVEIGFKKEPNGLINFYVKDNGDGIAEEYFSIIFEMFQRINNDDKGTGVGLALVKKIIDRHGGMINIESIVGEGTTFIFNFGESSIH
jgi:light-regulated signal transduction histidine kinase (bacteriophytochrome)